MSLTQLKDEAADLTLKEQRELIAFLVARQTEEDQEFKGKLATKINDNDPTHWKELEDVQKRYAE